MRYSHYKAKPDRYNPEFIGMAERYSIKKHGRVLSQSQKQTLYSSFQGQTHLDTYLRKTIEQKNKELTKLKATRERHDREERERDQFKERCQQQLENLKRSNNQNRELSSKKRQAARRALLDRNYSQKIEVQSQLQTANEHRNNQTQSYTSHKEVALYLFRNFIPQYERVDCWGKCRSTDTTETKTRYL